MTSGSLIINGNKVWYEKFGTGHHPLLLIPGAIGTGRSDFLPQLEGKDALDLKKYTLISIEPPGWGRSRPPIRVYNADIYKNDAECCYQIMESLGYSIYSVMGWSDGARTALLMSALYPSRIRSCIILGIVTFATDKDIKAVLITRNVKYWGNDMIENYYKVYGNEWLIIWNNHMDFLENIREMFPDGFIKKDLSKIKCPLLILHGDQDPIVDIQHPQYVLRNVPDARLHRFSKGSHNLHFAFAAEFKRIVQDFLDETDDGY